MQTGGRFYLPSDTTETTSVAARVNEKGQNTVLICGAHWFTNLEHDMRNKPLDLYKHYSNEYKHYDNYDAIEVGKTCDIPMDYDGVMGVPITFLDKYCPEQFEIIGMGEDNGTGHSGGVWLGGSKSCLVNGKAAFKRIFIKRK